ncbi:MAG: RNA methyltransferase, partial [Bacillota bacterium]|nr:RNA methyltransferase [Bacillota bacterium]
MLDVTISSANNRLIKLARQLSTRSGREKNHAFVVEGVRAVEEALAAGVAQAVLVDDSHVDKPAILALLRSAIEQTVESGVVETKLFGSLVETQTPQGILAIVRDITRRPQEALKEKPKFIVVSDGLQDPGNLGTLIRLADAIGADAFIATRGSVDIFNPKVVRASMGSLFHLQIVQDIEGEKLAEQLKELGYAIVAADVYGAVDHFDYRFSLPIAVVFGNEGRGLSPEWKECADLVRIPMPGKAESLNVG